MKNVRICVVLVMLAVNLMGQPKGWKRYVNRGLGFGLSYPSKYHPAELPTDVAQGYALDNLQSLLYLKTGSGDDQGFIQITYDGRPFKYETVLTVYNSATGWEGAGRDEIGRHSFYYFGAGGGGVMYPDRYIYDLNGHILQIEFDGPYSLSDKTPNQETKEMEEEILRNFDLRAAPGNKTPQISSIEVEGPKIVIRGAYLHKVELWAIPGAQTIEDDYILLGNATPVTPVNSNEVWIAGVDCDNLYPAEHAQMIFAKVLNAHGDEISYKPVPPMQSLEPVRARCGK